MKLTLHAPSVVCGAGLLTAVGLVCSAMQSHSVQRLPLLTPEQEEILSHMSIVFLDDGQGGSNKTIRVEGVSLQIVNGLGATNGNSADPTSVLQSATNGVGNLIIGYNELGNQHGGDDRTGSHMIVVGSRNSYRSYGGMVGGEHNTAGYAFASVIGGDGNTATGLNSVIVGGGANITDDQRGIVVGGTGNTARRNAVVVGGQSNLAENNSCVVGGSVNTAWSTSVICGGILNEATGSNSVILAGENNRAQGTMAAVCGGEENVAVGHHCVVGGGWVRGAFGEYDWVAGGLLENQ